jgi:hypothetical protein
MPDRRLDKCVYWFDPDSRSVVTTFGLQPWYVVSYDENQSPQFDLDLFKGNYSNLVPFNTDTHLDLIWSPADRLYIAKYIV